jgi:hypothetical protein
VTLVCEEAHRYVPVNTALGFEPCKRAIAKIAKEGRKYGASLCIVTQRPAEIDPTILSQCNTVFALRMSNDRDQEIVASAVADTGAGLLEFLPSLGQREAIAFGDGMALPVRIKFDELPQHALPRSSTARFTERWQKSVGDDGFLDEIVERWRMSGIPSSDNAYSLSMMADALGLGSGSAPKPETVSQDTRARDASTAPASVPSPVHPNGGQSASRPPMPPPPLRRDASPAAALPATSVGPRGGTNAPGGAGPGSSLTTAVSLRSLRDRLTRPLG